MIDERRFVPEDLGDARRLRDALLSAGLPASRARTVVMWLIDVGAGTDRSPYSRRSEYRLELAKLSGPPWGESRESTGYKGASLSRTDLIQRLFGPESEGRLAA